MDIGKKYDVVILDSGVDKKHPELCFYNDIDCVLFDEKTDSVVEDNFDVYGHATAIAGLIKQSQPDASILSIRIFNNVDGEKTTTEQMLIGSLKYVYDHLSVKVINMSCDICEPVEVKALSEITKKLVQKGVIMVSAFENYGGITYPACFEWVIGMAIDPFREISLPMEFTDDTIINLSASNKLFHVPWLNNEYRNVYGSSYYCAEVSAEVFSFVNQGKTGMKEVLEGFKNKYPPLRVNNSKNDIETVQEKPSFTIKKAAAFLCNKEMHSVIRYANELTFELVDVYDVRHTLRVGLSTDEILDQPGEKCFTIKDIKQVDWDSFDTLILGCVSELIKLYRRIDWIKQIIAEALKRDKNIYAFEDISWLADNYNSDKVFFPVVTKKNLPVYRGGRLYRTAVPIICVTGTHSQQGKFTLQMILRKEFKKLNCKIGQIGTEPHSLLFGMDYVFANGYNAALDMFEYDQLIYVNDLLRRTCEKYPDIILTGTQKGLVSYNFNNMIGYSLKNSSLINGIKPDYSVMTVSIDDELELIKRNIDYLFAVSKTKTLALVLFPVCHVDETHVNASSKRIVSVEEFEQFKKNIETQINIPVLFLNDKEIGTKLMEIILKRISNT